MTTVLLHDADCAFCTRSVAWIARLGCAAATEPLQGSPRLAAHGISRAAAEQALHAVVDERVVVGHEAVAAALATSRYAAVRAAGRVLVARPVAPLAARAYAWVAAHRGRLPGGTAACATDGSAR